MFKHGGNPFDYAFHVKLIHNKPEVNQRMTRNALLKEYLTGVDSC
jgi:kinesin family protein 11